MVKRQSDVTSELLATGEATMSQIAQLFQTDAKTLPQRLKGIIPAGRRAGYKVYDIREAASRLVKPGFEIEEFIRQMSPQEMHPLLLKEFWNGQRARHAFEKEQGNYWPTEDVVELMAVLCQGIRQTLLLVADDVNREDSLSAGQRKVFRRIVDAAINSLQEKLTEAFKTYYANRDANRDTTGPKPVVNTYRIDRGLPDSEDDEEVDI